AAVTAPAATWMGLTPVPMPLAPPAGVDRVTGPVPALRSPPPGCVMEPPVALPPVFVATVIPPPEPTAMLPTAASPVPPPPAITLMRAAVAVALVVVIEPPALMVNPSAPAPLVFALIVIGPLPAPPTLALSATASPLDSVTAPLPVDVERNSVG